jgi:hypothetical protein
MMLALKEYQRQWQAVAAAEAAEQQASSLALRWQQLNSIIRLAAALELSTKIDHRELDAVRSRWNILKDAHIVATQG